MIDPHALATQYAWGQETFGPGRRTLGITEHIRRELAEIEAEPQDLTEWADVVLLALDGAMRAVAPAIPELTHARRAQMVIDTIDWKRAHNRRRTWPDWRTLPEDAPIEHNGYRADL